MDCKVRYQRDENPREKANWISILSYFFALKMYTRTSFGEIQETHVYKILDEFSSQKIGNQLEREWKIELKKPTLYFLRPLFKMFWLRYLTLGIVILCFDTGTMVLYPLLIGKIVSFFTPGQKEVSLNDALLYNVEMALLIFFYTMYTNAYCLLMAELCQKINIGCTTLLYRKCLKLSTASLDAFGSGHIVTLITKDVIQFNYATEMFLLIIIGFFQAIILTCMMYQEIQVAALIGASLLFVMLPLQAFMLLRSSISSEIVYFYITISDEMLDRRSMKAQIKK